MFLIGKERELSSPAHSQLCRHGRGHENVNTNGLITDQFENRIGGPSALSGVFQTADDCSVKRRFELFHCLRRRNKAS